MHFFFVHSPLFDNSYLFLLSVFIDAHVVPPSLSLYRRLYASKCHVTFCHSLVGTLAGCVPHLVSKIYSVSSEFQTWGLIFLSLSISEVVRHFAPQKPPCTTLNPKEVQQHSIQSSDHFRLVLRMSKTSSLLRLFITSNRISHSRGRDFYVHGLYGIYGGATGCLDSPQTVRASALSLIS